MTTVEEFLANPDKYTEVRLYKQNLGDDDAKRIAEALKGNEMVTQLDLSENDIGDAGAIALAGLFENNQTLKTFCFANNKIGDAGFLVLRLALLKSKSFNSLIIEPHNLSDEIFSRAEKRRQEADDLKAKLEEQAAQEARLKDESSKETKGFAYEIGKIGNDFLSFLWNEKQEDSEVKPAGGATDSDHAEA